MANNKLTGTQQLISNQAYNYNPVPSLGTQGWIAAGPAVYPAQQYQQATTGGWITTAGGSGGGVGTYQYPVAMVGSPLPAYTPNILPDQSYMINTRVEFSEEEITRAEQIMEECDAARTP